MKKKNYKKRSKVYNRLGIGLTGLTTIGSFFAYEMSIDWQNFKNDLDNFVVVNQETLQLNMAIALPTLISLVVFLIIFRKKNKEYFKDKMTLSLFIIICILYFFYSVISMVLITLVGAWLGLLVHETVFEPLSKSAKEKSLEQNEIDIEFKKEKRRIEARKKALEEEKYGNV